MKSYKIFLLCGSLAFLWIAATYLHKTDQRPRRTECKREAASHQMRQRKLAADHAGVKSQAAINDGARKLAAAHADGMAASVSNVDLAKESPVPPLQKTGIPPPTPTAGAAEKPAQGDTAEQRGENETWNPDSAEPTPQPFAIASTRLPAAFVGASYSASLAAEGGEAPYVWSVQEGALPKGLSLDGEKGIVSGIPQAAGIAQIPLTAADAAGRSVSASCALEVKEQGGIIVPAVAGLRSEPLYLTTGALPDAKVGKTYRSQFAATGGTPPYYWSIHTGDLPDGITISRNSGAISGVPSTPQIGLFQAKVTDSEGRTDIAEHRLTVAGPDLVIATSSLQTGTVGSPYEQRLQASGGAPPYVWKLAAGALPDGLSIDAGTGRIAGTPAEQFDAAITLEVADSQGAGAGKSLELVIDSAGLAIVTDNLPAGEMDKPYEAALAADGGEPPYKWSLQGGGLPPGLEFNSASGILSGTPSGETGDYQLAFRVTDEEKTEAERSLTLTIAEPSTLTVTNLSGTPSDRKAGLTWTNPTAKDYARTVILRSTAGHPSGPEDGMVIYNGSGDNFLDKELQNGVPCYYAAIPYTTAGVPGTIADGSRVRVMPQAVNPSGPADPFADAVVLFKPLSPGGFGSGNISCVLGPPAGGGIARGSTHVASLHARADDDGGASAPYGGNITLQFNNNVVADGPGPDFVVFENVFYVNGDPNRRWMEPAIVSVSRDGVRYYTFPYDFVPHYTESGEINCYNPYCYSKGFAGVNPVFSNNGSPDPKIPSMGGGDAFDLSALNQPGLDWIRYVRITATGDNWLTDMNGDRVRHVRDTGACSGGGSSGFDLDAICAINY